MKRLSAQLGITCFTVLAVAFYLPETAVFILGSVSLAAAVIFLCIRKTRKSIFIPVMAFVSFLACLANLCYTTFYVDPLVEKYSGGSRHVEAVLSDESYISYSKTYYPLRVKAVDGEAADFRLLLKCSKAIEAEPDDKLIFDAALSREQADYNIAKGYYLYVDEYTVSARVEKAESHTLYYHVIQLRQKLREALRAYLPSDCSSLCSAIFIGDKYSLDHSVKENFRYAGASYLIVVSGMHFAVLCGIMLRLLRRIRNRWVELALMLLFILLYMAVTGFRPSVLRSGLMMTFYAIGSCIRRIPYSLNHLGIAGLLLPVFLSPYGAGDIGLILSFYATLAILLWADPIMKRISFKSAEGCIYRFRLGSRMSVGIKRAWYRLRKKDKDELPEPVPIEPRLIPKKLWNVIAALLAVSLAANILVLPLSIFFFRAISVVTLLSAVLLYGWIYLILMLSLCVVIFYWLGPLSIIALILSWPLYFCCKLVLWLVEGLGSLPFSLIPVREDFYLIWLAVTICLISAAVILRKRRIMPFAILCSAVILFGGTVLLTLNSLDALELQVYSCSDGLCTGIVSRGRLYLFTADARTRELYPLMQRLSDKYGGAGAVLCSGERELGRYQLYSQREFAISEIIMYDMYGEFQESSGFREAEDGSVFILDDSLILRTAVSGRFVVPYITAQDKDILIIPKGASLDDIPDHMRSSDIIVMTASVGSADSLNCKELIISSDEKSADAVPDYENVYYTVDGDVIYDLR